MSEMATPTQTAPELAPPEQAQEPGAARPVLAFVEAINCGDIDEAVRHLAPGALHHGRVSSYRPAGVHTLFGMLREVFPDLHLDVRETSTSGNRVRSRVAATGTHTGSFLGKEPTMQPVAWESVDFAEVDEDRGLILGRHWDLWSDPALWRKIGFVPAVMC
jgi:predicted ester cyclase